MNTQSPITVQATINAPMDIVWERWNEPEHITQWAFASDDWEAPSAENDLRVGGKFKTVMAARDKSESFDFTGTYTDVQDRGLIEYEMGPEKSPDGDLGESGRKVKVTFEQTPEGVVVTETFDPEHENPIEMQRSGWQAILDNFKKYAEQA